jgi:hypothetical protein
MINNFLNDGRLKIRLDCMSVSSRSFSFCQGLNSNRQSDSFEKARDQQPIPAPSDDEYSDIDVDSSSDDSEGRSAFNHFDFKRNALSRVSQYTLSIFNHGLLESETAILSPARILQIQTTVMLEHREVAVTHMLSVQHQYEMSSPTLFQAVGYLNRILTQFDCPKERLQLIALTSFWMAAKLEESCAPRLSDLCYIARHAYTEADFIRCERFILRAPELHLIFITSTVFLQSFLLSIEAEAKTMEIAQFFCDLSLIPIDFIGTRPDVIAVACVLLAKWTLEETCPTKRLLGLADLVSLEETKFCCVKLIEFGNKVLLHPGHLLYRRYTAPPATGVILEMKMTGPFLDELYKKIDSLVA